MAWGISVILSQECGCQPDLIPTPKHMVFDANDLNSIVQGINQLFSLSVKERRDLGNQNRNIISNFSVDIWAKKMVTMITSQ
jgi:trehalose-6-phosphate synthase